MIAQRERVRRSMCPFDPGQAVSGVAQGAAQIEAANLTQKGQLATAEAMAKAQADLEKQAFTEQTQYADSKEKALRDAISGVAAGGNPYASTKMPPPTFASGGMFGPPGSAASSGPSQPQQQQRVAPVAPPIIEPPRPPLQPQQEPPNAATPPQPAQTYPNGQADPNNAAVKAQLAAHQNPNMMGVDAQGSFLIDGTGQKWYGGPGLPWTKGGMTAPPQPWNPTPPPAAAGAGAPGAPPVAFPSQRQVPPQQRQLGDQARFALAGRAVQ